MHIPNIIIFHHFFASYENNAKSQYYYKAHRKFFPIIPSYFESIAISRDLCPLPNRNFLLMPCKLLEYLMKCVISEVVIAQQWQ